MFVYKRQNHFQEWLDKLNSKKCSVPGSIVNQIKSNINGTPDPFKIKLELRKMGLTKYYEDIPSIINTLKSNNQEESKPIKILKNVNKIECSICLENNFDEIGKLDCSHEFCSNCINKWLEKNNSCPMCRREQFINIIKNNSLSKEQEEILKTQFNQISNIYSKVTIDTPYTNFLNYGYILHKLFQLNDINIKDIHYPKSAEKLKRNDSIWEKICLELNWKFINK